MTSTTWTRQRFIEDLRRNASREVASIGEKLCKFVESQADKAAWGKGKGQGTLTFRSKSDFGLLSLFQMTSRGFMKFHINYLRQKGIPKPIIRDYLLKLESNFLRDFGEEGYPTDSFEEMGELFTTSSQVDKFIQCIEGIAYRLRQ
ncbi:MAG: hypothetical protein ACE5GH_06880 [Fidelibacterota bacterium]